MQNQQSPYSKTSPRFLVSPLTPTSNKSVSSLQVMSILKGNFSPINKERAHTMALYFKASKLSKRLVEETRILLVLKSLKNIT